MSTLELICGKCADYEEVEYGAAQVLLEKARLDACLFLCGEYERCGEEQHLHAVYAVEDADFQRDILSQMHVLQSYGT